MKTVTFFEVSDGWGLIGKNSHYQFNTKQEAINMATEFKNDPRSHNPNMSEEYVKNWKSKTYTIIEKTITTNEVASI